MRLTLDEEAALAIKRRGARAKRKAHAAIRYMRRHNKLESTNRWAYIPGHPRRSRHMFLDDGTFS